MAKTKYEPTVKLTAGELTLNMYPRYWDSWEGTASQLIDAGLLPEAFVWPSRTEHQSFEHDGFECSVQRRRLPGTGRGGEWVSVDYWQLTRYCDERGSIDAHLHEMRESIRREIARRNQFPLYWRAHQDSVFQAFMSRLLSGPIWVAVEAPASPRR